MIPTKKVIAIDKFANIDTWSLEKLFASLDNYRTHSTIRPNVCEIWKRYQEYQNKNTFINAAKSYPHALNYLAEHINDTTMLNYLTSVRYNHQILFSLLQNPTFWTLSLERLIVALKESRFIRLETMQQSYADKYNNNIKESPFLSINTVKPCSTKILDIYTYFDNKTLNSTNVKELGDIAVINNYYDIFLDCTQEGYIPSEHIFSLHVRHIKSEAVVSGSYNNKNVVIQNPLKILDYCYNILKFTIDLSKINIIQNKIDISLLLGYCSNITQDFAIKCYKEGLYLDIVMLSDMIGKPLDCEVLYKIHYDKCVEYLRIHTTSPKNLNFITKNPQIEFRESFKKITPTQLKTKCKENKALIIDNYCINTAFLFNNSKLLKFLVGQNIYPTNDIMKCYIKPIKSNCIVMSEIKNRLQDPTLDILRSKVDITI